MIMARKTSARTPALIIVIAVMALTVLPVSAVTVQGDRIALDVDPGTTYTAPIALSITPEEPADFFAIVVAGFGQSPSDGTYICLDPAADTSPYSARPFITLEKTTVFMEAGERAGINATIAVPADARDGGRYAVILVYQAESVSSPPAEAPVAVIPVFLRIRGGNATETGEITALEYSISKPGNTIQIATWFQNTGNHHFYGAVNNVTITDSHGTVVARAITTPFERALIPGQEVRFSVSVESGLADAGYILTSRIEQQDRTLLAEQNESLPGGEVGAETPASQSLTPRGTYDRSIPGFGIGIAMLAILMGIMGMKRTDPP
jgi:hypothetical protein